MGAQSSHLYNGDVGSPSHCRARPRLQPTQQLLSLSGTLISKRNLTSATKSPCTPLEDHCFSNGAQTTLDHMHRRQPRSHGPRHRGSSAAAKSHSLPSPHRCLQPPPGRRQRQRPARAGPFSFLFIAGSVCSYRTRSPQSNLLAESLPESSLKPSCKNSFKCK